MVIIMMNVIQKKYVKDGLELNALAVELHNTTLLLLEGYNAFFMCGALDTAVYQNREVVCGKAVGVKTLDDLYYATIKESSNYAKSLGIIPGMTVHEAFSQISKKK